MPRQQLCEPGRYLLPGRFWGASRTIVEGEEKLITIDIARNCRQYQFGGKKWYLLTSDMDMLLIAGRSTVIWVVGYLGMINEGVLLIIITPQQFIPQPPGRPAA